MTHILIEQGTPDGAPLARHLDLTRVVNAQSFGAARLDYVVREPLNLTRVVNTQSFGADVLSHIVVRNLNQTQVVNASTFGAADLQPIPFTANNAETTALLAEFDGVYSHTDKVQIDTLISQLKSAGVWSKLDYYVNFNWANTEHDSLIDWTHPTRSLSKVGGVTWTSRVGWSGVDPAITNARLTSGWNLGDGPHSTGTSFCMFCKIDSIAAPQNGMQPMGVWQRIFGGGPSTPDGAFMSLSVTANSGFAGGYLSSGNGNTSFVVGDGLGLWGTSHSGGTNITVDDGVTADTDAVSGSSTYTDPDGVSICGSAGLARRSFPGLIHYAGWGAALTASELAAVEAAFQAALLPPLVAIDPLLVDPSDDYLLVDAAGNYLKITDVAESQTAPSYSNSGGTGDRRGNIIWSVSVPINSANKDWDDLVDGVNTATASGLFWDVTAGAAEFIADFSPLGKTQLITEFKWHQGGTNTHGVWQVSGSDDGITWTDIDLPFTLGGATVQTVRLSNVYSYRMYRFKKVSGSTSNGPFLYEIEFKLGGHRTIASPTYSTNVAGAITVMNSTGLFGSGTGANLVNGNTTENTTFFNGLISTGFLKFDFGSPVVVVEARWYQNTAASHGVWKWQGSNDDSTYVDLAAVPANSEIFGTGSGGSPRKLHGFGGNTVAYRYYKYVQLTSTTSNGPFTREMEFRK